jgi:hypothetical protein
MIHAGFEFHFASMEVHSVQFGWFNDRMIGNVSVRDVLEWDVYFAS